MSELVRQFDSEGKSFTIIASKEFGKVKIEVGNETPVIMDLYIFLKMAEALKEYLK